MQEPISRYQNRKIHPCRISYRLLWILAPWRKRFKDECNALIDARQRIWWRIYEESPKKSSIQDVSWVLTSIEF